MSKEDILRSLADSVVEMDEELAGRLTLEALDLGVLPSEIVMDGLSKGMERVSDLFDQNEYFVPEVVVCADVMYAAYRIIKETSGCAYPTKGKIVIGVVEGDTHDIGKNIVSIMLEGAGFEVVDLGRNVPLKLFGETAAKTGADIVAVCSLMTTTRDGMKGIIEDIRSKRHGKIPFIMVGGAPVSEEFAQSIGADGYAATGRGAVLVAEKLIADKVRRIKDEII